ncbi:hypothetical protein ACX27_04175 [Nostoc piscinale CENA21]|uniref:HTH luxR-type domain-containing protein n=1 Tax=Nostoc piscinale CENA21 TaxID=224013 RepID=A0A0M4T1Q8_9NOSO|nr:LuxR C-terminal-related transcriptional regulator [Nostoc piscinale]ALF52229.1 hypothetical protein ACX27_04175 [Nostoc piscinale CENA21]
MMLALRCFTPKERLICELLARGMSYKAIASRLGISQRTVNYHACNIYSKLGVARKTGGLLQILQTNKISTPATVLCRSKEERLKVYQLRKEGLSMAEIAIKLKITKESVHQNISSIHGFLKSKGVKLPITYSGNNNRKCSVP